MFNFWFDKSHKIIINGQKLKLKQGLKYSSKIITFIGYILWI